jgi:hypothetical protein
MIRLEDDLDLLTADTPGETPIRIVTVEVRADG